MSYDNLTASKDIDKGDETLQIVLIDFGMAVEIGHPSALTWLRRDLSTVRDFFVKQGIKTLPNDAAEVFVTDPLLAADNSSNIHMETLDEEATESKDDVMNDDIEAKGKSWRHSKEGWDDEKEMVELLEKLKHSS